MPPSGDFMSCVLAFATIAGERDSRFATKVADAPFNVTSALEQSLIRECRASRHQERTHEAANDHSHP